jgi:hypothetical protein
MAKKPPLANDQKRKGYKPLNLFMEKKKMRSHFIQAPGFIRGVLNFEF